MTTLVPELRRELDHNAHLVSLLSPAGVVRRAASVGCAPSLSLDGIDSASSAILQGTVSDAGAPVRGARVRLLDADGAFVSEVPTGAEGTFRFFAETGDWRLRVATVDDQVEIEVVALLGAVVHVDMTL